MAMILHQRLFFSLFLVSCGGTLDLLPQDYGLFDPDHVVQVAIEMEEDAWDALRMQSRDFVSELSGDCMAQPFQGPYTYFHAAIDIDGESLPDVGIRKKGFIGSQSIEKPGFRINLDEYEEGVELFGTDNWTLNNSVQDPSLIRQCLTYGRFAAAGLVAPRCNFARVWVNGEDLGIYVHVEPIKRKFLRDQFGSDDGDLYEGTLSDFQSAWVNTFEPKTDETDTGLADIRDLTARLEQGTSVDDVLADHFDMDALLGFLAMENITGHWDGYSGANHNNYYLYDDPTSDRFTFIPWGTDGTLNRRGVEQGPMGQAAVPYHLLGDPALADRFESRVLALLDEVWKEDEVLAEIDRMEALLATQIDLGPASDGLSSVRNFVSKRRAFLEDQLPGHPSDLGEISCLVEKGHFNAEFDTNWGTLTKDVDITQTGAVDIDMTWGDWQATFAAAGVVAGLGEEAQPMLVFAGLIDPAEGSLVLPYFSFDPSRVQPEEPLIIGSGGSVSGAVLYTDASMDGEFVQAGFLSGGTLTFDSFGTSPDARVAGEVRTTILGWED
jgi:hypothetical protein